MFNRERYLSRIHSDGDLDLTREDFIPDDEDIYKELHHTQRTLRNVHYSVSTGEVVQPILRIRFL